MHELIEGLSGIEVVADDFIVIGCGNTIEEATDDHDKVLMSKALSLTLTSLTYD